MTRALAAADDDVIRELVAERREMREELRVLREGGNVIAIRGRR